MKKLALLLPLVLLATAATPASAGLFDKLKDGISKAAEKIKDGFEKAGDKLHETGEKVKEGFKDIGQKIEALTGKAKDFFKSAAEKVKAKIAAFGEKLLAALQGKILGALGGIIELATNLIGFKISDLEEVMGSDGKVDRSKVREIVLRRIVSQYVTPMLAEKAVALLEGAWDLIRPLVDTAVGAVITGLGSIPIAGGLIAGAVQMAYSVGTALLKVGVIKMVGSWVATKLATTVGEVIINFAMKKTIAWANKGLESLKTKWDPLAKAMDAVVESFYVGLSTHLKHPKAVCTMAK